VFKLFANFTRQYIAHRLQKANALYTASKFGAAIKIYRQILKRDSNHFAAKANLATALFETENYGASIPLFIELCKLDSSNPWWPNYLSQAYQKEGDCISALNAAEQAAYLGGQAAEHQLNLAYTFYETAEELGYSAIAQKLQKWHEAFPDSGIVKQCYASFVPDDSFTRSTPEYVENLFDVFAPDFDKVLADLHYTSPQEIAAELSAFYASKHTLPQHILDLGCGSGLCGWELRKIFPEAELVGVDISSQMLAEAKRKNIYQKLVKCDLSDCFKMINQKFDIITTSDVLTYFGCLDDIFFGVKNTLLSGGIFAFTISLNLRNQQDYFLTPSSRFVHQSSYIESLLTNNDFKIIKSEEKILRHEGDKEVRGKLFLAQKR
jgi:predicted TPR repeat methyltransferase